MQGSEQVVGKDAVDCVEDALLTDGGDSDELQEEYDHGKDGHQDVERNLGGARTDAVGGGLPEHTQDEPHGSEIEGLLRKLCNLIGRLLEHQILFRQRQPRPTRLS